jgi:hypothetical protein
VAKGAAITDGLKMEKSSGTSIKAFSISFT